MKKRCYSCKQQLNIKKFSWSNKINGLRNGRCKECQKKLSKQHYSNNKSDYLDTQRIIRERNKRYIFNFLKDKKCIDCGINNIIVLDFDHIDPQKKMFTIADGIDQKYSIEKLKIELNKCEIRCRNCHQIKTAKEFNQYRFKFLKEENGV